MVLPRSAAAGGPGGLPRPGHRRRGVLHLLLRQVWPDDRPALQGPGFRQLRPNLRHRAPRPGGRKDRGQGDCGPAAPRRLFRQETANRRWAVTACSKAASRSSPVPIPITARSPAIIRIQDGKVDSITSKSGDLAAYELEPQLITSLFDAGAAVQAATGDVRRNSQGDGGCGAGHRRPALLSARRRELPAPGARPPGSTSPRQRHEQGGSTITMQLSRAFFLTPEKTVKRKLSEMLIALETGAEVQQAADFRVLCQPRRSGPARFVHHQRLCRGVASRTSTRT